MKLEINIQELLKPENKLEERLIGDPEFIEGVMWGKQRNGHPEGKVLLHVVDVLNNLNHHIGNRRYELRIIALIHDTFKYKVDLNIPKSGENHHGMIARRFAEKYIENKEILDIIELHDEAYNSWSKGNRDNQWIKAEIRAVKLIERLGNSIDLFLNFYKADNSTGGKESDDYNWFVGLVGCK